RGCSTSPGARWSSATTGGSSTGSPPTSSPSRATPRCGGSRVRTPTTRPTATSAWATRPTNRIASSTSPCNGPERRLVFCGRRSDRAQDEEHAPSQDEVVVLERVARTGVGGEDVEAGQRQGVLQHRPQDGRQRALVGSRHLEHLRGQEEELVVADLLPVEGTALAWPIGGGGKGVEATAANPQLHGQAPNPDRTAAPLGIGHGKGYVTSGRRRLFVRALLPVLP